MECMTPPAFNPETIRMLRKRLGLTQATFGTRLGVTNVTVSRWEAGAFVPDPRALAGLATLAAKASPNAPSPKSDLPSELEFTADPNAVAAVAEAARLSFGHLASPTFATEVSLIDLLPHQRVAVYEHIVPQWPIRFLLADDAGAGKTIMTGLTVQELRSRRLVRRVLVVAPAGLLGNWQREMRTLFRIPVKAIRGAELNRGNPFTDTDSDFVVVSVDTLRSPRMFDALRQAGPAGKAYDLMVVDEAHKLSADRDPDMRVRKTARYELGEALAGIPGKPEWDLGWKPASLMLLTATPHMGKEYPYFALWRLLEPDTFTTPDALRAFPAERRDTIFHPPHQRRDGHSGRPAALSGPPMRHTRVRSLAGGAEGCTRMRRLYPHPLQQRVRAQPLRCAPRHGRCSSVGWQVPLPPCARLSIGGPNAWPA